MYREELRRIRTWQERHRRLVVRLSLLFVLTAIVDVIGTLLVYVLERRAGGSEVHTLWDSFFFTTVQLLTVSSQIKNPVTTGGRIVDIFLEIWAVLVVAGAAGVLTSFVMAGDPD
jgi:ion channel